MALVSREEKDGVHIDVVCDHCGAVNDADVTHDIAGNYCSKPECQKVWWKNRKKGKAFMGKLLKTTMNFIEGMDDLAKEFEESKK